MVTSSTGTRDSDANGLALMMGDSHHASNTYGLSGSTFQNVPKTKFLFFVKFVRPNQQGGTDWYKDVSFAVKNVDRPRVGFKTETVSQYNRKRIIQTGHEFQALQLRFHDTTNPALRRLFVEYYQYYFGDSKIYGTGGNTVYDVVMGEQYEQGSWGFLPPMEAQNYGYFFSHIEVYQLYQGLYEKFTLINPKLTTYNPDEFDYASGNASSEIQVEVEFEGITYSDADVITAEMAEDFGLNRGLYWNVENDVQFGMNPGLSLNPNEVESNLGDNILDALRRNISTIARGDIGGAATNILGSVAGAYDANRGIAVGITGVNGIKSLVNGNTKDGIRGVKNLVKGIAGFNKPGGLF